MPHCVGSFLITVTKCQTEERRSREERFIVEENPSLYTQGMAGSTTVECGAGYIVFSDPEAPEAVGALALQARS